MPNLVINLVITGTRWHYRRTPSGPEVHENMTIKRMSLGLSCLTACFFLLQRSQFIVGGGPLQVFNAKIAHDR